MSNFISAYHQPVGTVGDYRKSLSVNDALEIDLINQDESTTPYKDDVQRLGLISWHILKNQRISKSSLESTVEQLLENTQWYSSILLDAIEGRYPSAQSFFDAFKSAEPDAAKEFHFDDSELDCFRHQINHNRQFREDKDFIIETDVKEIYESGNTLVKAWLNVAPTKENPALGYKVLHFLKCIERLNSVSPLYMPTIREFGIATKSSSLYLVTDIVEGEHWNQIDVNEDEKLIIINELITNVEHLHGLGFAHGDLHPENIFVKFSDNKFRIVFIDIPDFSSDEEEPKNHLYSPDNIDSCATFERDNFAVMRLSCDLLGISWGEESKSYPAITEAIKVEISDVQFGFKDLERFKRAINSKNDSEKNVVEISIRGNFPASIIYPDNGHLYLQLERSNKNNSDVRVRAFGVGGCVDLIYNSIEKGLVHGYPPKVRDSVKPSDAENSQVEINFPIKINPDTKSDLSDLSRKLAENDAFIRALEIVFKPISEQEHDGLTEQLKEAFMLLEAKNQAKRETDFNINTAELWQAILDTEKESHPYIEVSGDLVSVQGRNDHFIIPYNSENDLLGKFNSSDCIEAFKIEGEKDIVLGEVVLKLSSLNEVRLTKIRPQIYNIYEGDYVYFRSKQDQASYTKRKAALKRLLDREGVISDIYEYFDSNCKNPVIEFPLEVTDQDFSRYDRIDDNGTVISLNEQQREAFKTIIQNGPISLLQGPPGTGKTEFIAAFVHYLIEKHDVNKILLVSQSHEAVNTAAERIRKHCSRLDTRIDVVRFSNREGAVSTGLKDVFSDALVTEKRELFKAEVKYRVESLSQALGVQPEYLSQIVFAELNIFRLIDNYWSAMHALSQSTLDDDDKNQIKKTISELDYIIRDILADNYHIHTPKESDLSNVKQLIIDKLNRDFSISPDEAKKAGALAKLSKDMLDVLETDRVNYDEFFARSRQLITGTCVGIGQHHIGIQNNQYDWVIIDEAARSIASELAIAMQSGKRILLVGDHQQLPPLYTEEHKKALARKLGIAAKNIDLDSVLQSDFARAFDSPYGHQAGATLLTQYRMIPQIGDIVSTIFYNGKLRNGNRAIPDIYQQSPEILKSPVSWLDTSSFGNKCHHQDDRGVSIYNRCEADLIVDVLKQISNSQEFIDSLKSVVKYEEPAIGIICMYGEQKRIVRQKFKENLWNDDFKKLVKIDTVDSYQGKENRVIILSVTRSDKDQNPGFLKASNRINVALSRAMDRLIIVGSTDMWRSRNKDLPLGQVLKFMSDKGRESGYVFYNAIDLNKSRKIK